MFDGVHTRSAAADREMERSRDREIECSPLAKQSEVAEPRELRDSTTLNTCLSFFRELPADEERECPRSRGAPQKVAKSRLAIARDIIRGVIRRKWDICRKAAGISETNLPRYANNTDRANLIGGRTLITQ